MSTVRTAPLLARLAPIVAIFAAAAAFIIRAENGGPSVMSNLGLFVLCLALFGFALFKNRGRWFATDRRWSLAAFGFAVPAVGLSVYLHATWHFNIGGIASDAVSPDRFFRFLPYYAMTAGLIGFAIGWVIGRNIPPTK